MRTPFYGALLMVAAVLAGVAVTYWSHPPSAVRVVVIVLAVLLALIGIIMTQISTIAHTTDHRT